MTHEEQRIWLIQELLNEQPEYSRYKIPAAKQEQKNLLRALMNVRFPKKEVRRHIKIIGDPDDEPIAQILSAVLKIPVEGTVRKTDLFGKFGLGNLPVFDEILDVLPCIAGEVSVRHSELLHHNSSIRTKSLNWI